VSASEEKERADKERLNFTKAAIEALPRPAKGKPWKYYYDRKVSGLGIGVGPSGVVRGAIAVLALGVPIFDLVADLRS